LIRRFQRAANLLHELIGRHRVPVRLKNFRAPMLPGFRFLFAAILLSVSLFIFGLGAASFLRAAHQTFTGNPSFRAAPEVAFAQRADTNPPVLAALRVDPPTPNNRPDETAFASAPTAAVQPPAEAVAVPATEVAALSQAAAPPPEIIKTDGANAEMPALENPSVTESAPTAIEALAKTDETKIAMAPTPDAAPGKSEAAIAEPEPATPAQPDLTPIDPATAPKASRAATKIATLGGPPVEIAPNGTAKEKKAQSDHVKDEQSAIKKRAAARRAAHRRELLARAQLAAQQQANPFAPTVPVPLPAPAPR
jgi:hypothetical protein